MSTPPDRPESQEPAARLVINVGAAGICKFILNTTRRFVYPFAPVLSRGLGVPLTAITSLIALNWAAGSLAIFAGPLADRLGYRLMMITGMVLLAVGLLVSGLFPLYAVVLVALFLAALGKAVFDPAVQAYVSDHVPYRRRGLVIGVLEFSWAGSALLGIPALALIIDRFGWRSPFFVMGLLAVLGIALLVLLIPPVERDPAGSGSGIDLKTVWQEVLHKRSARGALAFVFLVSAANDTLFVVYGAWLENAFGLSIVALGLGTGTIGLAELLGETLTATLADRIGLKRSVMTGLTICIILYVLLPLVSQTIFMAFASLFLIFVTFEFVAVTSVSMATELLPRARATMMATFMGAAGLGRVAGALIGGPVWLFGGIFATGIAAALISALALVSLWWGLRGWGQG
ncbi:MAG: MFS transporter [Deltaproteobacteria bacterium]|jgi:predicted MFS family arabinose efflux permease|nr:MFS transporter [Deltaproteobacteria bacterium]MBW2480038.1 MFS transporter [Deltaproteobacteria bacterium]